MKTILCYRTPINFTFPLNPMNVQCIFELLGRTYHRRAWLDYKPKLNKVVHVQWNLVIKRSDITKPSYNKVILLVPAIYISLFFYPDIMRNCYNKVIFMVPRSLL